MWPGRAGKGLVETNVWPGVPGDGRNGRLRVDVCRGRVHPEGAKDICHGHFEGRCLQMLTGDVLVT